MVRAADVARLVALAIIWSASFVFFRVLVGPLGTFPTATFRVLIARSEIKGASNRGC